MGLLRRAVSVAPFKGLLQRSLELLAGESASSPLLTQAELDRLLAERALEPPRSLAPSGGAPADVPLTWGDAGIEAPAERGPGIELGELNGLYQQKAGERQGTGPRPAGENAVEAAPSGVMDAGQLAESVVSRIGVLPRSAQFPSRLFSLLREALSITKGALLFFDPLRMVYAPWASHGYDTTTHHRLRIPLGAADSLTMAANGEPLVITGADAISAYQKYFSSRELGLISRMILAPFVAENTLTAILLVTDASPPFSSDTELLSWLSRVCREASPAVRQAREGRANEGTRAAAAREPRGIVEELPLILGSPAFSGRKTLLVSLSFREYLDAVAASDPYSDSFRLEEDMRFLIECFASDLGRVIQTGPGAFVLVIQDLERKDLDLFLHQLLTLLRTQFGEPDGGLALREATIRRTRSYPDEEPNIPALVSFFSG